MGTKTIMVEGRAMTVPDDITDAELESLLNGGASATPEKKDYDVGAVPGAALRSLPKSAGKIIEGAAHSATHPIDTIKSLLGLAGTPITAPTYGIMSGLEDLGVFPKGASSRFKDEYLGPSLDYSKDLTDAYGGWSNIKRTLAEDPLRPVMDLLGLTPAGKAAASSRPGQAVSRAVSKVASGTGHVLSEMPASLVDMFVQAEEGIGPGAIRDVAQAGREGKSNVLSAITKGVNYQDVLERIHGAIAKLSEQRSTDYNRNMKAFKGADQPVNFDLVDQAVRDANEQWYYRGKSGTAPPRDKRSPAEVQAHETINDKINQWKTMDPAEFHTAYGFDQMKQELNKFVDSLAPDDAMKTPAQAYAGKIMSSIRDTIRQKAPREYGEAMDLYGKQSDQLRALRKDFQLKDTNTDVQSLRSLQRIYRRTADVAHGEKENLLRTAMEDAGEKDLMQILAGGQFNPKLPSGLRGAFVPLAVAGVAGGTMGPGALLPLIGASPRLTGLTGYGAGRAYGAAERALPGLGTSAADAAREYLRAAVNPTVLATTRRNEVVPEEKKRGGALSRRH